MKIRTGIGYDIHQLSPHRKCILGGVEIPSKLGPDGHSDADVLCHAIADAVLGSLGLPDIGYFFPPEDDSIEGISSLKILEKCASLAAEKGAIIQNVDSSLIAESPRIKPHIDAMKSKIASSLGIQPDQVGVKATTNETLGALGRKEGIAAVASALVIIQ